jgi:hypothetical protein
MKSKNISSNNDFIFNILLFFLRLNLPIILIVEITVLAIIIVKVRYILTIYQVYYKLAFKSIIHPLLI